MGSTVGLEESLFRMDPRPPPGPLPGELGWNPRPEPGPLPWDSDLQQRNRSLQGRGSTFLQKFLPVQPTNRSIHAWPHSQSRHTESAAGGEIVRILLDDVARQTAPSVASRWWNPRVKSFRMAMTFRGTNKNTAALVFDQIGTQKYRSDFRALIQQSLSCLPWV